MLEECVLTKTHEVIIRFHSDTADGRVEAVIDEVRAVSTRLSASSHLTFCQPVSSS